MNLKRQQTCCGSKDQSQGNKLQIHICLLKVILEKQKTERRFKYLDPFI